MTCAIQKNVITLDVAVDDILSMKMGKSPASLFEKEKKKEGNHQHISRIDYLDVTCKLTSAQIVAI